MAGSGVARPRRGGLHPRSPRSTPPATATASAIRRSTSRRSCGSSTAGCFRATARSSTGSRGCSCSTSCWPAPSGVVPASLETWFLGLYLLTLALLYAGLVRIARSTARLALVDRRVRRRRDDSPPHRQDRPPTRSRATSIRGSWRSRSACSASARCCAAGRGARSRRPRPPAPSTRRPGSGSSAGSASRSSSSSRGCGRRWASVRPSASPPGWACWPRASSRSQRMDDAWLATLAGKDYLFATDWGVGAVGAERARTPW